MSTSRRSGTEFRYHGPVPTMLSQWETSIARTEVKTSPNVRIMISTRVDIGQSTEVLQLGPRRRGGLEDQIRTELRILPIAENTGNLFMSRYEIVQD